MPGLTPGGSGAGRGPGRVLFVTNMIPTRSRPARGPFIGQRVAALSRAGVEVDVLNPVRYRPYWRNSPRKIAFFALVSFLPLVRVETASFRGARYRVVNLWYTVFSRHWVWLAVFLLHLRRRYDLLHYHFFWYTEELVPLRRLLGRPAVVSSQGSDIHQAAAGFPAARRSFRRAARAAGRVIFVSRALRAAAEALGLAGERDVVVPNGYDPDMFRETPVPPLPLTFGFVGHLATVKRADKLPEIFAGIRESLPDARMVIVGGAGGENLRPGMEEEFAARGLAGAVEFAGEVRPEEVTGYYARMHVLLMPSRNEGFPNVPVEARACGVPVAGSDNGGVPEAVGGGGVIVEDGPGFERRFAEAAVELARDLPTREEVAAGVRGLEWDGIAAREMAVYRELMDRQVTGRRISGFRRAIVHQVKENG